MIYNLKAIRKQFLGLPLSEADFKVRKFEEGHDAQERLELVAKTVVQGYNTAVEHGLGPDLMAIATSIDKELQGFFNEGIGMGLHALDTFSFSKKKQFWSFIEGEGNHHEYMSYIGAGLTCAVFKKPFKKLLDKGSVTSWLALDGIGFYYAMFKTPKVLADVYVPKKIKADAFYLDRFDNGVGRALWFYASGEPQKIADTIKQFPESRRGPIWSGVGLAATYAGGVTEEKLRKLRALSGEHCLQLGQGSILAIHTRFTAGNPSTYNKMATAVLVGSTAEECEKIASAYKAKLEEKKYIDGVPSFKIFLQNVRQWIKVQQQEQKQTTASASAA